MRIDQNLEPHLAKSMERIVHQQAEDPTSNEFKPF
jgi:hypothetical protein